VSEISDWIRLTATPGVGCVAARKLLLAFGLPHQVFSARYTDLKQVVAERQAQALSQPVSTEIQTLIDRTMHWCEQSNYSIVTLADQEYPTQLLEISDPPIILYAIGQVAQLKKLSVGVVGSRNATAQGIINARQFATSLSNANVTVVSGLASGIDAAAHQGGLAGKGSTIAVIGTGLDIIYPARNKELAHQIAQHGCIISEYPLGTPPVAANFPRRNRIISGLSKGLLVIEAAAQSGSLITARLAAEQGRDVFAIPGSIHSPLAKGCHQLIKQGAKLIETAQDILDELRFGPGPTMATADSEIGVDQSSTQDNAASDSTLLLAMGYDAVHPDELSLRCGIQAGDVTAQLTMLELEGRIEAIAGGMVRRLGV
jgi:DNA processing protein